MSTRDLSIANSFLSNRDHVDLVTSIIIVIIDNFWDSTRKADHVIWDKFGLILPNCCVFLVQFCNYWWSSIVLENSL